MNTKNSYNSKKNTTNSNLAKFTDKKLELYTYIDFTKKKVLIYEEPQRTTLIEILTFDRFNKKYPFYTYILK